MKSKISLFVFAAWLIAAWLLAAIIPANAADNAKSKKDSPPPPPWKQINAKALQLSIENLIATFGDRYPQGRRYLKELEECERQIQELEKSPVPAPDDQAASKTISALLDRFKTLQRDAMLANPLLDFDRLLLIKRKADRLGLPQNWQGNCALPRNGYDNEIAVLSPLKPDGAITTFYKPGKGEFVGDVDLHFNADKMLFSMPKDKGRWEVWEIGADGKNLRQVTVDEEPDVDNYDPCYLPDGRILFDSTRCFHGVPCVGGGNTVANFCVMNSDGSAIRQICFDQDHDWCPTVLNNGRILYSRWEYSDSPHYFTRLLFHMNPDGTNQMEYYGSNSPWPNSIFYARPIPNHPTMVVGVISGHHGVPRMGELIIFDPAVGRQQAGGAVQRIPGYGVKVQPIIGDSIVNNSWPKFLHPYPLSNKYFLVSMQPNAATPWGIYLVDIYDNLTLVREEPGYALFEPLPFRKTPKLPVIPDHVDLSRREAMVYLNDIYLGKGLEGVPRGTVKKLRIYEFHYAYPRMGGHSHIGIDGPWDVHRIHGTVPVEADGSANFVVPANMPLAIQPLDSEGRALQLMRSWFTAMPGETISCVGCHESQNSSPPAKPSMALSRPPSEIVPWYGPARGFSFAREVQPVLDKHCVACHNGEKRSDGKTIANFRSDQPNGGLNIVKGSKGFTASYVALHPYVRRPGPESDYFMQKPLEYHPGTCELVQMLTKGHHGVKLNTEAWDRLYTWIDLNVPDHGTWTEHRAIAPPMHERRLEMRTRYANRPEDPEQYPTFGPAVLVGDSRLADSEPRSASSAQQAAIANPQSAIVNRQSSIANPSGWPFDAAEAKKRQAVAGAQAQIKLDLGAKVDLDLAFIPAGEFVMGDPDGCADERPVAPVKIEKSFYMGKYEITNAQYALFDPTHDSAYISVYNKDQSNRGEIANRERQPVIRITWKEATAYCEWLSKKTGRKFSLPTEAQWEYACRAGTATSLSFGDCAADFGKLANLADQRVENLCRGNSPRWIPNMPQVNDGAIVTEQVGKYLPNAWGLCDMHGNVWEWTRTTYKPYPYDPSDGRDGGEAEGAKAVRGGSFYDRPLRARSAFRLSYPAWQCVYSVGFRVICETDPSDTAKK